MTSAPTQYESVRATLRRTWQVLTPVERTRAVLLSGVVLIGAVIDMLAIAVVMPFVGIIVDDRTLQSHPWLAWGYAALGEPAYDRLLMQLAAAIVALIAVNVCAQIAIHYAIRSFAFGCQVRMVRDFADGAVKAPYSWHLGVDASRLLRAAYEDVNYWATNFLARVFLTLQACMSLTVAAVIVLAVAPLAGVVALLSATLIALALLALANPRIQYWAALRRRTSDAVVGVLAQLFDGIKDVIVSTRGAFFVDLAEQRTRLVSRAAVRLAVLNQITPQATIFLGQAALVCVTLALWLAGDRGSEIAAKVALLVLVTARLIPAFSRLSGNFAPMVEAGHRLRNVLDLTGSMAGARAVDAAGRSWRPAPESWRAIRFEGVGFHYATGSGPVLSHIDVAIERHRSYGVAGPSGAGKSTLVDLLLRLLQPTEGAITVDGTALAELDPAGWRRSIGYVPQTPFIASSSLRDNVAFGIPREEQDVAKIEACLQAARLGEVVAGLPDGLETQLGDRGVRLSGGQRQRLAIARALYRDPSLLVLDEATSALDAIAEREVQSAVAALTERVTVVAIAHRLSTLREFDEILLLDGGRVVDRGGFDALAARNDLFARLLAQPDDPVDATPQAAD